MFIRTNHPSNTDNDNITKGIVWIVFDKQDHVVGCFTKQQYAKEACANHPDWYYQGQHTVK